LDRVTPASLQQAIKYFGEVLIVMYVAEVRTWGIRQKCRREILRNGKVVLVRLSFEPSRLPLVDELPPNAW